LDICKINKQGYGFAKKGHGNSVMTHFIHIFRTVRRAAASGHQTRNSAFTIPLSELVAPCLNLPCLGILRPKIILYLLLLPTLFSTIIKHNFGHTFLFYKHNFYKHSELDFWQKFKHKLSISSVSDLPYQLKIRFEFNKIGCN